VNDETLPNDLATRRGLAHENVPTLNRRQQQQQQQQQQQNTAPPKREGRERKEDQPKVHLRPVTSRGNEMESVGEFEYNAKDLIGHGAFAVVYKGRNKKVGHCFPV